MSGGQKVDVVTDRSKLLKFI